MVKLENGRSSLRPIAGTRKRGKTPAEDMALADELLSDEKEKAEHLMLVDLGRNDLGRTAAPGSVQVKAFMTVERYSHVMHIVSDVDAMLSDKCDAFDLVRTAFPAGTLSGAPKIRAMELINELEPEPRGVYGGAVGYFSYTATLIWRSRSALWKSATADCSFRRARGSFSTPFPKMNTRRHSTRRGRFSKRCISRQTTWKSTEVKS